ncbi:FHA domain-containing protein [Nocardiopsis aegyptia]|uniref:FHA domain-containing protein n=1 Tax=Nocardiopsis aegyptia TaxID=220378 RepID=UPI00366CEA1C
MRHTDFQIAVQAGDGLIGRFPTGVMLLVGDGSAEASDRLIELFADAEGGGTDPAAGLEELFGSPDAPDVSAFGAMVESGDGTSLYLRGPVEVTADSPNADLRAWGRDGGRLLRYEAPSELSTLTIRHADVPAPGGDQASFGLRTGVVSGGGVTLERTGAETGEHEDDMLRHDPPPAPRQPAPPPSRHGMAARTAPPPPPPPPPAEPAWQHHHAAPPDQTTAVLPEPAPGALPGVFPEQEAPSEGGSRPGYTTRLLARVLVTVLVGLPWTLAAPFVLPVGFAPSTLTYTMVLLALGLLFVLGALVWDPVVTAVQRRTGRREWPRPLFVGQVLPEALVVFGVQFLLLDAFVVNATSLALHLAGAAVLMGAGAWVLGGVPAMRRRLSAPDGGPGAAGGPVPAGLTGGQTVPALGTAPASSANGRSPQVWGVNCRNGHFNRPDARYCAACGTAMHGLTREPVQGPRPPLGYLVSDHGYSYELDGDYVIGRAPQADELVRAGRARALSISDPGRTLAEAHADVRLDDWDVVLTGRGNTTGTFVNEPDSANWIALAPGQPFAIRPGTSVRLGHHKFVYRALNQR